MAWPGHETYPAELVPYAKPGWIAAIRAIAEFEPVVVVAVPGFGAEAEAELGAAVDVIELPLDEVWLRDYGPLFVESEGGPAAVDFGFDVWGARRRPYDQENALGGHLAAWLGVPRHVAPLVLEGGAITTDGRGTLIAVESSIVDEDRNPGVGRDEVEAVLQRFLGIHRVIWLPHGLVEDQAKKGHVDNVARFVGPGRIVCHTVRDESDPSYPGLAANRVVLETTGAGDRGARGPPLRDQLLPRQRLCDRAARESTLDGCRSATRGVPRSRSSRDLGREPGPLPGRHPLHHNGAAPARGLGRSTSRSRLDDLVLARRP